MLILADNDVGGPVRLLRQILESPTWKALTEALAIEFIHFTRLRLERDASDREVWEACQAAGALLITANRAGGPNSLEQTIRALSAATSLPIVTLADPQRVLRDRPYAEETAFRLLDIVERIESLRGAGRLFAP
jgi:hypothetical protein